MRRIATRACLLLTLLLPRGALARPAVVSGHNARAPIDWKEDQAIVGACVDILREVLRPEKIEVDARAIGPWARVIHELEIGEVDIMCGLYETRERKEFAAFTEPFLDDPVTVFVWHDRTFPFNTLDDLKGKTLGEITGASRGAEFEEWKAKNARVDLASDQLQNLRKLELGRIDYFVSSRDVALTVIKENGYEGKIVPLSKPISVQYLPFAISRKSPLISHLPQINKAIAQMRKDGTIARFMKKNAELYAERHPGRAGGQ